MCEYGQARLAYVEAEGQLKMQYEDRLPTREDQLSALQNTPEFDVLVVGGGATGSGCALDAVTRSESNFIIFKVGADYLFPVCKKKIFFHS